MSILLTTTLLISSAFCGYLQAPCNPNINFQKWINKSPPNTTYELLQTNTYIRHGDRTIWQEIQCFTGDQPIWDCSETIQIQPSNAYAPASFAFQIQTMNGSNVLPGNCLIGQLTEIGFSQQITNGQGIRERYIDHYGIIPNSFQNGSSLNNIILVRSDNSPRVQQSAMAFFEGIYSNLNSEPAETFIIPFESGDSQYQIMTPNTNVCPYLSTLREINELSSEYQSHYNMVTIPLVNEAQKFMAEPNATENMVFDCGTVWGCHSKSVPNDYTQQMYDAVNTDTAWYAMYGATKPNYINATKYNNGPFLKLVTSRLYNGMMENINNKYKDNNTSSYKMYLYGGHDSGVVPIIAALGYNVTGWVPYADIITFELFKEKSSNNYYVLFSYNGEILTPSMCDCENNPYQLCSWEKFMEFMKTVTPTQEECPGMRNVPPLS